MSFNVSTFTEANNSHPMIFNERSSKMDIFNLPKFKAKIIIVSIFRVSKAVFLFNKLFYHIQLFFILILGR